MKVVLFACIEKNIGDDLFVYCLCKRYPNIMFTISNKARYGALAEIPNIKFSRTLEMWCSYNGIESSNIILKCLGYIVRKVCACLMGDIDYGIYIVGNAFKNTKYIEKRQSLWIKERRQLVKKFFLLSTNFGPYNDIRWKREFDDIFSQMDDVCFRDKESYKAFDKIGNVRYAPDAVLSLGKMEKKAQENNIVISIIDCALENRPEGLKKCGDNYEDKMVEVINYFSYLGYQIVVVCSNTIQDVPAANRIIERCKIKQKIKLCKYQGNYNEIFSIFSSAQFTISTRLHTIILSWLFELPVIPIVYDIKIENMLQSYNFSGKYYNIQDIELLKCEDIEGIIANYKFDNLNNIIQAANNQFSKLDIEFLGEK